MATDCFENFQHEEILNCPNDELQAGLAEGEIYYMPTDFIQTLNMPTSKSFEGSVTVTQNIVPIAGKGFQKLRCQTDMNSLASALVGNPGNKKDQSTLTLFLAGFRAKLLGFKKQMKNVPAVYIVKDRNGRQFLIGTILNPARLDNFELTTGDSQDSDNGGTATIISNWTVMEYTGDIPLQVNSYLPESVTVTPGTASIEAGSTQQFTAAVIPSGATQAVTCSVPSGVEGLSVDSEGLVTTTISTPADDYTITATCDEDNEVIGTATLTVTVS